MSDRQSPGDGSQRVLVPDRGRPLAHQGTGEALEDLQAKGRAPRSEGQMDLLTIIRERTTVMSVIGLGT